MFQPYNVAKAFYFVRRKYPDNTSVERPFKLSNNRITKTNSLLLNNSSDVFCHIDRFRISITTFNNRKRQR